VIAGRSKRFFSSSNDQTKSGASKLSIQSVQEKSGHKAAHSTLYSAIVKNV
jgi:hypothetical protein